MSDDPVMIRMTALGHAREMLPYGYHGPEDILRLAATIAQWLEHGGDVGQGDTPTRARVAS